MAPSAGYFTKSLYWGLVLPFGELAVAVAAGVLATVLSMIGPLLTATRVSPLEALQVVPSAARAKRLSIVRAVFCGLFLLLGGGLVFQAFSDTEHGLMWAAGGGAFLSLAILGAAPFYIPLLLRLFGRIFGFAGPTVKLAASNAARNPRRASATAVALMLAVGLVVTLQVGVSTMRTSAIEWINQRYPVDVSARATSGPLPSGVVEGLRNSSGVAKVVEVSSKQVDLGGEQLSVRNVNPGYAELGLSGGRNDAADGVVTVSLATARAMPSRIELPGAGEVEVRGSNKVEGNTAAVSESVFEKLSGTAEVREAWVKLTDRNSVSAINQVMNVLRPYMTQAATGDGVVMGGGATAAGIIEQVVNVLMVVLTALLGVAVAIALIGVGNTLGLSVLESGSAESALLRALGIAAALAQADAADRGDVLGLGGHCPGRGSRVVLRVAGRGHLPRDDVGVQPARCGVLRQPAGHGWPDPGVRGGSGPGIGPARPACGQRHPDGGPGGGLATSYRSFDETGR